MYRRGDPRWNRTIQHISENIEHANEAAQENLYGFTQSYVSPCVASLTSCCNALTAPCFPSSNDRRRNRNRARSRGRAELSFDFYDDWDADESDGLLGWRNDSLERFLGSATTYGATPQPTTHRPMTYTHRARDPRFDANRRKPTAQAHPGPDPTLIPSSSYFGFLPRLPFNLGAKGLRYKPSAADLTEHPRRRAQETQPLIEDSDEDPDHKTHRRARSNTHTSGHTTDSLSSRGDIFPSEDELDDAVPLDDEFTVALERRSTAVWDESGTVSGGKSVSSRTPSSGRRSEEPSIIEDPATPSLADLQREEDRLRRDEEEELARKRDAAQQLAVQRGLVDSSSSNEAQMRNAAAPLVKSPAGETPGTDEEEEEEEEEEDERPVTAVRREDAGEFVPARLPYFG